MSMVLIPVPEDLEQVLKPMLERDPDKGAALLKAGFEPDWPSCISSGRRCVSLLLGSPNSWRESLGTGGRAACPRVEGYESSWLDMRENEPWRALRGLLLISGFRRLIEQRPGLLEVGRIKPFGEPTVGGRTQARLGFMLVCRPRLAYRCLQNTRRSPHTGHLYVVAPWDMTR